MGFAALNPSYELLLIEFRRGRGGIADFNRLKLNVS
jgi:hypothetical protein